jgi:putative endonuclease
MFLCEENWGISSVGSEHFRNACMPRKCSGKRSSTHSLQHIIIEKQTSFTIAFLMYFVYILYSEKLNRFYIGSTENLRQRLEQHNNGLSKFTSKASDWRQVYFETFTTRTLAQKRERDIKRKKSRKYIEQLISQLNKSILPK